MNVYLIGLLCCLSFSSCATEPSEKAASTTAKSTPASDGPISLTLTLTESRPQTGSRLVLTLMNKGRESLPATGWQLFFNGGTFASTNPGLAKVKQVNGDLHVLTPGPAFRAVSPGQSVSLGLSSRRLRNKTDFPGGFFLLFATQPDEAIPVDVVVNTGTVFAESDRRLAEWIFDQNAAIQTLPARSLPAVFPSPQSYEQTSQGFVMGPQTVIVTDDTFQAEASFLANALASILTKKPRVQSEAAPNAITLRKKEGLGPEGYELQIDAAGVRISATTGAGLFYGVQSLQTSIPPEALARKSSSVRLPGLRVADAPRFPYRGFMLDIARNFQPTSEVLKVLDLMALYKLNVLHLHFSDDEGWRVQMPSLPELTTVGGTRAYGQGQRQSLYPAYGSGPSASNPAGTGFYSKAEFVQLLRYAHERHIEVIPEIESPGHARAALRAMDARHEALRKAGKTIEAERYMLRDRADRSAYRSVQGWNDNVIDVSLPSTYAFMERVVDDLIGMYREAGAPLRTIHFGGDEVPAGVWQQSPSVKRLMAANPSIRSTADLWDYYFQRINQLLQKRGLFLSGWEEVGLKKAVQNGKSVWVPNPLFADARVRVNVWQNLPGSGAEDLAYRLANAGYPVILTNVTHLYLDLAANASSEEAGQYWGGYVDLDKPFYFIPFDYLRNLKDDATGRPIDPKSLKSRVPLTDAGRKNIVGIEAPLWSETNRTPVQFEYKLLPKLLAVAERAWAKDPAWATEPNPQRSDALYARAWSEFINVVGQRELPRLDTYSGGFAYRIPTPGARVAGGKLAANVQFPGLTIRYTTDGTEPTTTSPIYTEPIPFTGPVRLRTFTPSGRAGQTIQLNK